jgi:hypothetical protein
MTVSVVIEVNRESMVALTRIERANSRFSIVQFGLTDSKYVRLVRRKMLKVRHEWLACPRGASAAPGPPAYRWLDYPIQGREGSGEKMQPHPVRATVKWVCHATEARSRV